MSEAALYYHIMMFLIKTERAAVVQSSRMTILLSIHVSTLWSSWALVTHLSLPVFQQRLNATYYKTLCFGIGLLQARGAGSGIRDPPPRQTVHGDCENLILNTRKYGSLACCTNEANLVAVSSLKL